MTQLLRLPSRILVFSLLWMGPLLAFGHPLLTLPPSVDNVLSGKIMGSEGPLPGASVVVKGTALGTTTDSEGNFKLSVPAGAKTLVFSFIGYLSQEVAIGNKTVFTVTLTPNANTLNELVVVGYGTQKKSDLTGSISSIKAEDITQLPTQRVDQALQGRAAGVLVVNTDGAPGGNTVIRVRGLNSVNGGNNALVVIDGLQGGNLNSLNPNDIENIEILKDASATAIYGSQGANGVILVTTKMGRKGKPIITYSYNYGSQALRKKLDVMNAADFARTANAYRATQNQTGTPTLPFTDAQIQEFAAKGGTDWQDVIYRTAPLQNHQLSIGGGTDNLKYLVSAGYLNQQGILINSGYKRFTLRANLSADITKWARFGLNWAGSSEVGSAPPFGGGSTNIGVLGQVVLIAPRWDPIQPVYDANGNYSVHVKGYGADDTWNPLASAAEPYVNNKTIRNTLNTFLEFNLLRGLTLRVTGGAILQNRNNRNYNNLNTYDGRQFGGVGTIVENVYNRLQNSNILTYDNTFAQKHRITVTAVAEQQYEKTEGSSVIGRQFLVDQTGVFDMGGATSKTTSSFAVERVINSYLGRINYAYAGKYLLTASYRADGSSVFGANNKWGYFPSASVAWRAAEEKFVQSLALFSDLKFRASWGVTGNQGINPYQTLSQVVSGFNYPYDGSPTAENIGFYISSAPNPNLRWESTTQTDVGVDIGLFNGRLTATADYYYKTTKDLLLNRTLAGYTGFDNIIDNTGSIENKGFELALGGDPVVGNFRWNTGITASWNRNKVLDLGGVSRLFATTNLGGGYNFGGSKNPLMWLQVGQPFGQMRGWAYEGTWRTSEAEQAAKYGQLPGDPHYTDINGDGKINTEDITVIGNAFPKLIYGWSNRLSFKGFELTLLIQGTQGNNILNATRIRLENPSEGTSVALLDRWTPDHQDTNVPALIDQLTRKNAALTGNVTVDSRSGRWIEDGSYLRLKNVTLAYNVSKILTDRIKFNRVRAYVSATNYLTFTKYKGYDPEISSFNANDTQFGIDFGNYPAVKTLTVGVDLAF